ncbi:1,2-dihydroxy-3-keto-5-methylthiopentene dioxygenase [Fistulifera solaris]|uniref:Acireductone dioxygenase n=1 Tax=Fistulifera solaris TaxID=1519565 RepID=A0A1Z5JVP3_FISSO|nr:1,2-dihydroxy-3-keto-5-methylthiopentene dioxygenase [Fistulifera solaris]|eukprot:GAX18113.1 1,2-dihydroxy-3-keto-5-methylthiopentene dioxygenase [Fistulifera solaris]
MPTTTEPESKKLKMDDYPMSPDTEWPDAWLMPDQVEDQCAPNRLEPNVPVSAEQMRDLGICYWKMEDVDNYDYPIKAIPWDPKDAKDPKLQALRDARGYSYADIITVHPDHLPDFDLKIKAFFEEHIHDAEEIRYIVGGSGYFDVRNKEDKWVRVHVKKGDLMTLPEGIYHRFTCDEDHMIHAMRLFIGQPVWTPFNRPQEDHPSRKKYAELFLANEEKKEDGDTN